MASAVRSAFVIAECWSHTPPIVKKLVTYARYAGHSSRIALSRCSSEPAGTLSSRTSSVIAIANTPSLKASSRPSDSSS
ncbi:MAG TPA: hypothetical protein VFL41_09575 [Gaiellaceae bacterium]|nr:hypothetical protein [Gaiellaceae bacterium]